VQALGQTKFFRIVLDYFSIHAIEILFLKRRISVIDSLARGECSKFELRDMPARPSPLLAACASWTRRPWIVSSAIGQSDAHIRLFLNANILLT